MFERFLVVASFLLAFHSPVSAQDFTKSGFEFPATLQTTYHVGVRMRDGVELATDTYLPNAEGSYPTLLVRDMYSNGTTASQISSVAPGAKQA